jgi:hypothetical protein
MTEYPEMRNTALGEVLAELLEKRGLEVTPSQVGKISGEAGLDGAEIINRMVSADALKPSTDSDLGNAPRVSIAWGLGALAEVLDLSDP